MGARGSGLGGRFESYNFGFGLEDLRALGKRKAYTNGALTMHASLACNLYAL